MPIFLALAAALGLGYLFFMDEAKKPAPGTPTPGVPAGSGAGWSIGLQGAQLPQSERAVDDLILALGQTRTSVFDGQFAGYQNGINYVMFGMNPGAPPFTPPPVGTKFTIAGIPVTVAFVQQMPMSVSPDVVVQTISTMTDATEIIAQAMKAAVPSVLKAAADRLRTLNFPEAAAQLDTLSTSTTQAFAAMPGETWKFRLIVNPAAGIPIPSEAQYRQMMSGSGAQVQSYSKEANIVIIEVLYTAPTTVRSISIPGIMQTVWIQKKSGTGDYTNVSVSEPPKEWIPILSAAPTTKEIPPTTSGLPGGYRVRA
jgi:hypothetical protein